MTTHQALINRTTVQLILPQYRLCEVRSGNCRALRRVHTAENIAVDGENIHPSTTLKMSTSIALR
jgi:hypothetical protein